MTDGWRRDRRVAGLLADADVVQVAVAGRNGPHVTPAVFDVDRERLWFVTPRASVKARVIARRRRVGGLVAGDGRAVMFGGRARIVDPLTARGVLSPGRLLDLPFAVFGYAERNAGDALGTVLGHPSPTLALSRVMVSVDIHRLAVIEGEAVRAAWGRWDGADRFERGPTPLGRVPDLSAVPPGPRRLLVDGAAVALGWSTPAGPVAFPGRWRAGDATVEVAADAMVLADSEPDGPACLTVERSGRRLRSKEGILVAGTGSARRDPDRPGLVRVTLDARRATWWVGEDAATVNAASA